MIYLLLFLCPVENDLWWKRSIFYINYCLKWAHPYNILASSIPLACPHGRWKQSILGTSAWKKELSIRVAAAEKMSRSSCFMWRLQSGLGAFHMLWSMAVFPCRLWHQESWHLCCDWDSLTGLHCSFPCPFSSPCPWPKFSAPRRGVDIGDPE